MLESFEVDDLGVVEEGEMIYIRTVLVKIENFENLVGARQKLECQELLRHAP